MANRRAAFGDELAALDYLNATPVPVAPRLLGADARAGLLLMEDLGEGATLADSLMAAGTAVRGEVRGEVRRQCVAAAWSFPGRPRFHDHGQFWAHGAKK